MPALTVRILKPEKEIARIEGVSMLIGESVGGQFAILPEHTSFCTILRTAPMEIRCERGGLHRFAISGGVLKLNGNRVEVFASSGEMSAEIDVGRAEAAKSRAQKRLDSGGEGVDKARAERALKRSLARIQAASYRQG